MTAHPHQLHRHPALPWAELRVSHQSPHCYRLHMHAEYSIGLVDAGSTVMQHAGGNHALVAGDVVLIEPGAWHACNPAALARWSYRMLYVQADWLHQQLGVDSLQFAQRALHDAAAGATVERLCQALLQGDAQRWTDELCQWLRQPAVAQARPTPPRASCDAAIQHALQQLHLQPDAPPSVEQLAHMSDMSASRFIRRFKAATGVTPGAYRLNLRLNGARALLAQGTPLADAAHHMGFSDQAHLQRSFKAHHAMTPGRYALGTGPR